MKTNSEIIKARNSHKNRVRVGRDDVRREVVWNRESINKALVVCGETLFVIFILFFLLVVVNGAFTEF